MLRRILLQLKNFFLLPQHLHNFLIQLNLFEDRWKFSFESRLDYMKEDLEYIKQRLENIEIQLNNIKEEMEK